MIEFEKTSQSLLLIYEAEYGSPDWVAGKLDNGAVRLVRTFQFEKTDIANTQRDEFGSDAEDEHVTYTFSFGVFEAGYYRISGAKLGIKRDVYLSTAMPISKDTFVANRNISVFARIAELVDEDIYIGGDKTAAIPLSEFDNLLKTFPTTTEVDHYARSRVARVLKDYFETTTDAEEAFGRYMRTRSTETKIPSLPVVYENERIKFEFIRDAISGYLREENSFGENEWRDLMLKFVLLIFPKYVCVLRNIRIKDFYSNPEKPTNRYIDIGLLDANGHLDLMEIKKPFANCLVSEGLYRGNFTPRKELSGAVMQAEKYLFHLNKWGVEGEQDINRRQSGHLPTGMTIRITNPRAIIIAGRSHTLSYQQAFDFEFIKRKYANIMDILSYDDLLRRLSNIIEKFRVAP
ncbi:MAG TPA: Shedu immune nuclease family protein [Rhizomicrobium sp.]|jgi:hypothetical protein